MKRFFLAAGLIGLATACGGSTSPQAAQQQSSPAASPRAAVVAKARPSPANPSAAPCDPGPDLIVWTKAPGAADAATALGSNGNNGPNGICGSTLDFLQKTSPTGSGYCTVAALASDNAGYEDTYIYAGNPPVPPRPKHVILSVGGSC